MLGSHNYKWQNNNASSIGQSINADLLILHPIEFQVLNDLYHLLRFETCKSIHRAFEVVLSAMDRHLRVKHMQISGRFVSKYYVNLFFSYLKFSIIFTKRKYISNLKSINYSFFNVIIYWASIFWSSLPKTFDVFFKKKNHLHNLKTTIFWSN